MSTSNQPPETEAAELTLGEGATRVPVPFNGNEYVCPFCEATIPNRRLVYLSKPPRWAHVLNDIVRCCWCKMSFSPRSEATVLRK